jgi:hypothetical protein
MGSMKHLQHTVDPKQGYLPMSPQSVTTHTIADVESR